MIIKTKFNIGDEVFGVFRHRKTVHDACSACAGLITPDGFVCATCLGTQAVSRAVVLRHHQSMTVTEIHATVTGQAPNVSYYCMSKRGRELWRENNMFTTEAEARALCDCRNGKESCK